MAEMENFVLNFCEYSFDADKGGEDHQNEIAEATNSRKYMARRK